MKITLKAARVNTGLKLSDVAKIIGRNEVTVSKWEKGESDIPMSEFDKLCKLYNVEPVDVIVPEYKKKKGD